MDEMNADFLENLDFDWRAAFDGDEYTLINPSTQAILKGKSVSAVHCFFTDFGNHYLQDEAEDESRTALNAYTLLFRDTGYTVHLVSNFQATTLNYQKNQTKAERFHYYNERYKAEFIISGHNVYLYNKIGAYKPDVRIDEDLNVKDAKITMDTQSFWTWCKCYFDKEDDTDGGEEVYRQEYVYQNHDLIAIYGEKEGPALYQGAIKHVNVMKEFAQSSQEASYSVSHEVSLIDLRKQGYEEFIFNEGDTVRLSLKSINQTLDIRVIEIDETFVEDEQGDKQLIDFTLTLGNENVVKAHKNSKNTAMITLQDWIDGRREMPFNILPGAIQRAADIVMGDTDSVMEYRKDRLIGHHDKNAGNNVQLNVSGLVFNRNGVPKTAMTYEGIIADAITAGIINTMNVRIIGQNEAGDIMTIDGSVFKAWNIYDTSKYVEITKGEIHVYKGGFRLTGKDGREMFVDGLMRGARAANINPFHTGAYLGDPERSDVLFDGMNWIWDGNKGSQRVHYIDDQYWGRYLDFRVAVGLRAESEAASARIEVWFNLLDGTEVARAGFTVYRDDEDMLWENVRLDLQAVYNSIPDYRTISLYAGAEVTVNKNSAPAFRINRGEFNG